MRPEDLRTELENLIGIAKSALEDFETELSGKLVKNGYRVHLNDLRIESDQLLQALDDEDNENEDYSDDHHNDELNGN